jgi:hypothetical protein
VSTPGTNPPAPHAAAPAYPIPRPPQHDSRFTVGLVLDLAAVLTRHGYPPAATGPDLLHLQQALFTTIYQPSHQPSKESTA